MCKQYIHITVFHIGLRDDSAKRRDGLYSDTIENRVVTDFLSYVNRIKDSFDAFDLHTCVSGMDFK